MPLKIVIDRDLCSGYGNCIDAAPEVFDVDDKDIAIVIAGPETIASQRDAIELAAKLCPIHAITLEES